MKILMILIALTVVNCTSIVVKNTTYDPSVLPIREIRLVIYYGGYSQKEVHEMIDQTNIHLIKEVGIKLVIQEEKVTYWESRNPIKIMRQMDDELWRLEKVFDSHGHWEWKHTGYNWDMAIAVIKPTPLEITKCDIISSMSIVLPIGLVYNPCFVAGIDDSWRRYIVMKTLNVNVLLHEIACHGFIFHRAEGDTGEEPSICDVSALKLPIEPPLYGQAIFSERDKKEILENKWRVFGKKPKIPKRYSKDIL